MSTTCPQCGHLPRLPALSSAARSFLPHSGHCHLILSIAAPPLSLPKQNAHGQQANRCAESHQNLCDPVPLPPGQFVECQCPGQHRCRYRQSLTPCLQRLSPQEAARSSGLLAVLLRIASAVPVNAPLRSASGSPSYAKASGCFPFRPDVMLQRCQHFCQRIGI